MTEPTDKKPDIIDLPPPDRDSTPEVLTLEQLQARLEQNAETNRQVVSSQLDHVLEQARQQLARENESGAAEIEQMISGSIAELEKLESEEHSALDEVDDALKQLAELPDKDVLFIEEEKTATESLPDRLEIQDKDIIKEQPLEKKTPDKKRRLPEMAARIDAEMKRQEEAERERPWKELRTSGANPTAVKEIARRIIEHSEDLKQLSEEADHLERDTVLKILNRAAEDEPLVIKRLADGASFGLDRGDIDDIQENSFDFTSWKGDWNIAADIIRDAEAGADVESQLAELGDKLAERPDRLELLLGQNPSGGNGPKTLPDLTLAQRQSISERLRYHGFAKKSENIALLNALVLEHPDRFRDIYNTLPIAKEQTEELLLSVPEGAQRNQVMIDLGLKIEQTKWNEAQVAEQSAKYERDPEISNQEIIAQLRTDSAQLYEAGLKARPEIAQQFAKGADGWNFADLALRNSQTSGKRMVDVAGPILAAQNIFTQAVTGAYEQQREIVRAEGIAAGQTEERIEARIAESDQRMNDELTEFNQALAKHGQSVELTRLAAEKELALELQAINRAREELYEAIIKEDPASQAYIEERRAIERKLAESAISEVQDIGEDCGLTAPTRNYMENMVLPAVGKSAAKELRAWATPETHQYGYSLKAESMTNDVAIAFGKRNVVPSADRLGPEGVTNFQEWYPSEALANIPWGDLARRNPEFADQLKDVLEVRYLVRDIDGHAGNMKRTPDGRVITIDHGQAFVDQRTISASQEPYNFFRCYAAWAVGGEQLRPESKKVMSEVIDTKAKKREKTRAALWKLFNLRFGQQAEKKWRDLVNRAKNMIEHGLPTGEESPLPAIQEIDREAKEAAYER